MQAFAKIDNPSVSPKIIWGVFGCMTILHILLAYFILRSETLLLFSAFAVVFLLYGTICNLKLSSIQIRQLVFGAIALRLVWFFAFPQLSDDYARFIWDGRLLANGFNPFDYLPSQLMSGHMPADAIADANLYPMLNSPDYFTLYPPMMQTFFGLSSKLFPHNIYANILALKAFILFAEIGSLLLIPKLCKLLNVPPRNQLLYALNPLVIAELVGNVHFEGVVIFFLFATLYYFLQKRFFPVVVMFTAAVITKLVPLIFMPIIFFYYGFKKGLIFSIATLFLFSISWLPFINATLVHHVLNSIDLYFNSFEFNGSIYYLVRDIVFHYTHEIDIQIIAPILAIISTFLMVGYAVYQRKKITVGTLPINFIVTLLIYLAFTTMVHPWYILPMVALCIFTPYRFPIVWSAMIVSSYYEYHIDPPIESNIQLWLEYLIVIAAIIGDLKAIKMKRSI